MTTPRTRRKFLVGIGATSTIAVAGCTSDDEDGMETEGMEDTLAGHPLGQDLEEWPRLGQDPFDASATLIVLDDPSCPRCAAFHEDTISELESNYVESGELTVVNRPYPVVYEWGEPAAHALEATTDRDEDAYWGLLGHYFDEQGSFDVDNVFDRTETWLDENTDLDAQAVVEDARDEEFADRIDATLSAGDAADAGEVTPSTFAFQDGDLQTSLNGSVSLITIETVLGL